MGIVGFLWAPESTYKLTLLQNRDNWRSRVINEAAWDENNQILGGFCEETGGTWFGCSRQGRVAFLVDTSLKVEFKDDVHYEPVRFLQSTLTPRRFAQWLKQKEEVAYDEDSYGVAYHLIVADLTSSSMIYICKQSKSSPDVTIQEVAVGVHTLSVNGLDYATPRDLRMQSSFCAMIYEYENQELPPLSEIAAKFMYEQLGGEEQSSSLFLARMDSHPTLEIIERYGTTSTTAFVVKSSNQVMFYEMYLDEDGGWKDHNFTFNINN